jgi:hypothetical protein
MLEEIRMARVMPNDASIFHKRHGVALQSVACRITAGGNACGDNARAGGKDRAIRGELLGAFSKSRQMWRGLGRYEIAAQAVEVHKNNASYCHASP